MDFIEKRQALCLEILKLLRGFDEDMTVMFARTVLGDVSSILAEEANRISVKSIQETVIERLSSQKESR